MIGQHIAAFGPPRPLCGFTSEGDLLAVEARLVANDRARAALAFKAVAQCDPRWFALNRKVKFAATASSISNNHPLAPWLPECTECRLKFAND
jgi:hypothetical protein